MSDYRWPSGGHHHPKAVIDHSTSLETNINNVLNTAESSSPRYSDVPSDFRDKIAKGIRNGVEGHSNRRGFKWSETDKGSITKSILESIIVETDGGTQEFDARLDAYLPSTAAQRHVNSTEEEVTRNLEVFNGTQIIEIKSYTATINLNIVHQASVNRMEGMTCNYLGEAISVSLEASFSDYQFRGSVRLSVARFLDCGDVEVVAHAEHRGDLERLVQTTPWHEEFERSLGPLPIQTYKIRMHNMRIGCMIFMNRKEKSAVIRTLANTNFPADPNNGIIRDISWCGKNVGSKTKGTTALMVEFCFPEEANKALAKGLFWQGIRHACNIADPRQFDLQRCLNCQKYGHHSLQCSTEPQCGNYAGQHPTKNCTSTNMECVLCGGPHTSADGQCPLREQTKTRRFPTTRLVSVPEPVAEVQDVIITEPDLPETTFDRTREVCSTPGILLRQTDEFGVVRLRSDTGLQSTNFVRPKREAEDALPEAESGGDMKRIKQEDLKQEEPWHRETSMPPYRKPSSYIVHRPE